MIRVSILVTLYVLANFFPCFGQDVIDVSVQGISDESRDSRQQDRDEAILDAKLQAIQKAGVSIEAVTVIENFQLRSDWVETNSAGVLLQDFDIVEMGYGEDGLYHVVLIGKVSKGGEDEGDGEGDKKFSMAKLYLESDVSKALQMMQDVVDNYGDCTSADDALYCLIRDSEYDKKTSRDRIIRLKAYYPDSPFIALAETWIEKKEAPIKKAINSLAFVRINSGTFKMGTSGRFLSKRLVNERYSDEGPLHQVTIKPFYMMTKEVTQKQWKAVMGSNPSFFRGDNLPVENISWNDCQDFISKLNQVDPDKGYRLPSEAEWEYACRAGTTTPYHNGERSSAVYNVAWIKRNSEDKTHLVGSLRPNSWGLYDMHGNVWEFCLDRYHENYKGAPSNGAAWTYGGSSDRIVRGGAFHNEMRTCRSGYRGQCDPSEAYNSFGFRLVRSQ